jgi:NSS family neurotransmitter:Na+ symporter
LGSVWRFPWYAGKNGGAAFVIIYLLCVAVVGIPVQWLELSLGRRTGKNPVGAYAAGSSPTSPWRLVGYLGLIVGIVILSYYTVVAGWTAGYIVLGAGGELMDKSTSSAAMFKTFTHDPYQQVGYLLVFMALSVGVVWGGVKGGIERVTSILMPVLVLLMIGLIVRAVTLPQAAKGLQFYLYPDFSQVTSKTVLLALGQAFYAMSLGMGAMLTYGSYLDKKEDLAKCGLQVAIFVTAIALMAGFIVFPVVGGAPDYQGPGLVFVALVEIFRTIPAGRIVAVVFFLLLAIAALTSTISLVEVVTAYLIDEHGWKRKHAVVVTGLVSAAIGIPSALSLGASESLSAIMVIGGETMGFLDLMDFFFGNLFLILGVFCLCLFAVIRWGMDEPIDEVSRNSKVFPPVKSFWRFSVLYLAPLAISWIIVYMVTSGQTL